MKKSIISLLLLSSSVAFAGLSDGEAAVLGIFLGSQLQKHSQQYEPPHRQYPSNGGYSQPQPRYNSDPCANMQSSIDAAYCRGAQRRYKEETRRLEQEAYNQGYRGN